jgi:predicted transcriptional regulator
VSSLKKSDATTAAISSTTSSIIITRKILQAAIESSDVDHFGGTTQSRIIVYSRLDHRTIKPHLDALVDQGLITRQCMINDNPHHARCTWDKTRRKRAPYKTTYRVTSLGYAWLMQQQQQHGIQQQQKKYMK